MINKTHKNKLVLAIDPGFDRVGWAIGQKSGNTVNLIDYGLIQTNKDLTIFERYLQISENLDSIISKYHPKTCAIEKLFFARNKSTALKVSEARGIIIISCLKQGMSITEHTPNEIKLLVSGAGNADKIAMAKMVRIQLNLSLEKINDDVIDALAILLTACNKNNLLY